MTPSKPIAEKPHFIVLDHYTRIASTTPPPTGYQTEAALEKELIEDLQKQGYEYLPKLTTPQELLKNLRLQLQALNQVVFTDEEWQRFLDEYLYDFDEKFKKASTKAASCVVDGIHKVQVNYVHDFVFDDGHIQNICLVDKKDIARNKVQVINQFEQTGTQANRYDVTILVNGLPMVQVELKKRGEAIREAFNQVHRYSKESFNSEKSLYKFLQLFVISNGTDTRYFANTVRRDKNSFDFTMNWADSRNELIKDLKDFTATFFQKDTLLKVLLTYSVLNKDNVLLVMRPYQIAATERILWKIKCAYEARKSKATENGGYIWHTTGSGKTLTSFKAARLATELDFIDKVLFVVDRRDLDNQTMLEYKRFSPESVNGSADTQGLKRNMEKKDNRIVVTTIQKLNNLMKSESHLPVYEQQVVFIFDECHRSQFGEAQKNIRKRFKKYYQFGFTGTPIFPENASGTDTTSSIFGAELHSYVITDAIRDEKVLKFKVDYNDVRPKFKALEMEQDEDKLKDSENKQHLLHPDRIRAISQYILKNFRIKTHRNNIGNRGFNAMFAVSSIDAAKLYYEELNALQKGSDKPLKIATIFSYPPNEEQHAVGEILDEGFEPSVMNSSSKEFLSKAISDYNAMFKSNYGLDSQGFQNYYRDLSEKVKNQEIDLLIVVGMFLTGFDAPTLNTLFVDKNLRYHGLIQAFSRTNRIYDATKTFGNIVTFRDLEEATIKAIQLFGTQQTRHVVLERSYKEYIEGFTDEVTGEKGRGYLEVVKELKERFPHPDQIETEAEKKAFVKLFGEYLKLENILQNYDEFTCLKALQAIDREDKSALEAFKEANFLTDDELKFMLGIDVPEERTTQDYRSAYNDIRDWFRQERMGQTLENPETDWDDIVFEVDLLKSQEIDLDYILELLFEHNKKTKDKDALVSEMRRIIRSSLDNRAKESLIVDFINATDLDPIQNKADIIEAFFAYAKERQNEEAAALIDEEHLKDEAARRYLHISLKREYASMNGTDFNNMLPQMSLLNPRYLDMKQRVFQKISAFVEKFKGVGGFERR